MRPVHVVAALAVLFLVGGLVLRPGSETGAPASAEASGSGARAPQRIDGPAARQKVSAGATLLDVRTPGEFAERHVDGALNVPVQELEERLGEVPRDRPVVVYCLSGGRSAAASRMLAAAGYEAYDLGPMSAW
ncbi:MAG: rhodanese-like domain-containing protein [Polyangiales bacterium]